MGPWMTDCALNVKARERYFVGKGEGSAGREGEIKGEETRCDGDVERRGRGRGRAERTWSDKRVYVRRVLESGVSCKGRLDGRGG